MTPQAVAEILKHWRHLRDLSQRALAERAGITYVHVARLELAQSDPRLSTLVRLAGALEISLVDLLTEPKASRPARKRARGEVMDTERTQATVNPEVWAAGQVEEVAKDLEKKQKRGKQATTKARGIIFRARANGEVVGPTGQRGEWWTQWFDADGRRHREKAGTKAAAVALYQRRKTEVRQCKHFPESMRRNHNVSLKAVCTDYTESLEANGRDPRAQAKTRLEEVAGILGDRAARSITPQDIERLKARLSETPARGRKDPEDPEKERPRSPASVNRYLQDLRAAFNLAKRNGKVETNPVADVKLLRENNKRVREMTACEEKAVLKALDPARRRGTMDLRPLIRLLPETGLRLGEACNLRGADIDWRAEVATLRDTKAGVTQYVPLSAEALAILRALSPGGGYVFHWPDGQPLSESYVTHAFAKAVRKAGITDLHVHDTQHTFACRKLRAGVDIYTVSKLLRHASVVMSERYAHLSQADLKAAVSRTTATSTATGQEGA